MKKNITKYVFLIIASLISISNTALSQNIPNYVPQNGLVGWWPFDNNSDDYSGNQDHGINKNVSLTDDRFGNCNQAYHFDSVNSHIKLDSFKFPSYTYSLWVRMDSIYTNSRIYQSIFSITKNNETILRTEPFSSPEMTTHFGTSSSTYYLRNDVNIQRSKYYNITVTYHSNRGRVYFNGNLIDSARFINSSPERSIEKIIGPNPNLWNDEPPLIGSADDLGLWNRELNRTEILNLYRGENYYKLIYTQPTEQNVDNLADAIFEVKSNRINLSFQWQIFSNGAFVNLQNDSQHSGVNTDLLSIKRVTSANHFSLIRCIVNSTSCSDTTNEVRLIINQQVGIRELNNDNTIVVKNNPTKRKFYIDVDDSLLSKNILVFNSFGRIVYSSKISANEIVIDASSWNDGLYYLKMDGLHKAQKLIKI